VPGHGNKTIWRGLRLLTEDEMVKMVNLVKENSDSSIYEENGKKDTGKQVTFLTNLTNAEAKKPKRLENLDPCPTCGSDYLAPWPDGSSGYFCKDCYPDFDKEG